MHNEAEGVIVKGFVSDEELVRIYSDIRLVIVPLRYGAGIKGKVIEALYNGLPIVSTSIGAEGIQDAEELLNVADTKEGFASKVIELYNDVDRLRDISIKASGYIRQRHSIEAVWSIVEEDFV